MRLNFNELVIANFGCFKGEHKFLLNRSPGLYFVTGNNKLEPSLTSNGVGKSSLWSALYWCMTGKTLRTQRPGASIEAWNTTGTVSVTLDISVNDENYLISRSRRPNNLTINGQVVDQAAVDKLINLNEETLKRTILVGQFVPLFLELKPEQQSSLFTESLGLDVWIRGSEKATQEVKVLESSLTKTSNQLSLLTGRLSEIESQYEDDCKREAAFEKGKQDKDVEIERELKSLTKEVTKLKEAFEQAEMALNALPATVIENDDLRNARALERDLVATIASCQSNLSHLSRQRATLERKELQYLESDKTCPECGQAVSNKHIVEKKLEVKNQVLELSKVMSDEVEQEKAATKQLKEVKLELERLGKQQQENQQQGTLLQVAYSKTNQPYRLVKSELQILQKSKQELGALGNPYTDSCAALAERYIECQEQKETTESEVHDLEEQVVTYKLWITAFKEIRLNLIDETLSELELTTSRHMQSLGLNDWGIKFQTERETKSGTVSHTFTTLIYPPHLVNPIPFESYSGGESQRLQLAVTFGLSGVLLSRAGVDTNIEAIDEPTKSLSRQGVEDVLSCLRDRAHELNRSIYFIDHNSLESGYFDGVIMIEKDQGGARILD